MVTIKMILSSAKSESDISISAYVLEVLDANIYWNGNLAGRREHLGIHRKESVSNKKAKELQ